MVHIQLGLTQKESDICVIVGSDFLTRKTEPIDVSGNQTMILPTLYPRIYVLNKIIYLYNYMGAITHSIITPHIRARALASPSYLEKL